MPRGFRHRDEALNLMARLLADAHRDRGAGGVLGVTASALLDLLARLPATYARAHAEALRRDVPYALRTLRRRPLSTAAAVATLAIGIGLNAAVFSLVDWVLLRPLPDPTPHELVRVLSAGTAPVTGPTSVSFPEFLALSRAASLRASAAFSTATRVISGVGLEPAHMVVARVAGDLFGTLGVHPSTGRGFDQQEAAAWFARGSIFAIFSSREAAFNTYLLPT